MNVRSFRVGGANGPRFYEMDMDDWCDIQENMELEPGMIIIFTRKRAHKLWLTGFSDHGHLTTDAHFKGATTLQMIQPPLQHYETGQSLNDVFEKYMFIVS